MSHKQAKKIRKLFKNTMADEARRYGEKIGNSIRKKPKWFPKPLWLWIMKFFLKI